MSKAVLVLDMPENCFGCRLCTDVRCGRISCAANHDIYFKQGDTWEDVDGDPLVCPLRSIPQRRDENNMAAIMADAELANRSTLQQIGFNRGWNACLDEMEVRNDQPETLG